MRLRSLLSWLAVAMALALLALLFLLYPQEKRTTEKAVTTPERGDGPMLVFIHGAASYPQRFDWLAARLAEAGWTAQRRFSYDCRDEWIEDIAKQLEEFIRSEAGDREIAIIAHSMGGIISRYYVEKLGGAKKTKALVLLGTPNRGTTSSDDMRTMFADNFLETARIDGAPLEPAESILIRAMITSLKLEYGEKGALQLTTNSPLIADLNSRPLPQNVRYLVVAGTSAAGGILGHYQTLNRIRARLGMPMPNPNDGIVPLRYATIPEELGMTKVLLVEASHVALTFNKKVLEKILSLLEEIEAAALPRERAS